MSEMSEKKECINGKAGYVYVFASPSLKGWVKVGGSSASREGGWEGRLKNYQTYAPEDYYPVATLKTVDWHRSEKLFQRQLAASGFEQSKEFFKISSKMASELLRIFAETANEPSKEFRSYVNGMMVRDDSSGKVLKSLKGRVFHAAKKGSDIRMKVKRLDCFTVLKGSKLMPMGEALRNEKKPYAVSLRNTRTRLESDPNTVKDGTLISDFDFGSSSRALAVMLGVSSMQGPQYWIDKDGRPLADYLPKKG